MQEEFFLPNQYVFSAKFRGYANLEENLKSVFIDMQVRLTMAA
jgi:hypothetical protein